jgi:hypothetical protein
MTPSAETVAPAKNPDLRFGSVVTVYEEGDDTVIVFRDSHGAQRRVVFPATEERFLLELFVRLRGGA